MDNERQELIVKVIGQMTGDLMTADVDPIIQLLNEVPNEKLTEYLKA